METNEAAVRTAVADALATAIPAGIARQLEPVLYEKYEGSGRAYRRASRELIYNLRDPENAVLRTLVACGEIDLATLAEMSSLELARPSLKRSRALRAVSPEPDVASAMDSVFRCGKCGKNKTKYRQLQTRSADEGMTTFVTCILCKNRWRC